MTDPTRWLDPLGDGRRVERELLEAGVDTNPPPGEVDRSWRRLLLALGPGSTPGPPTGGLDAPSTGVGGSLASAGGSFLSESLTLSGAAAAKLGSAAVTAAVTKAFLAGLAMGGLLTGTGVMLAPSLPASESRPLADKPGPAASPSAPRPVAPAPRAPHKGKPEASPRPARMLPRTANPSPAGAAQTPPAAARSASSGQTRRVGADRSNATFAPLDPTGPHPAPRATRADRAARGQSALEEEAAVLRDARSRLHSGDLSGAFARLETARTWFPRGALVHEREALTVELLSRSGQHAAARQRAQAFVKAFPRSAFAPRMRRVLEQLKQP